MDDDVYIEIGALVIDSNEEGTSNLDEKTLLDDRYINF